MWFVRRHVRQNRTGGLTVPQFRALVLLDRHPDANLSLIAEHLGSSQPSASRLISGLVSRGYVTRSESPEDRRHLQLLLTRRGQTVLHKALDAAQEAVAKELESLDADQRAAVDEAMTLLTGIFACRAKS